MRSIIQPRVCGRIGRGASRQQKIYSIKIDETGKTDIESKAALKSGTLVAQATLPRRDK